MYRQSKPIFVFLIALCCNFSNSHLFAQSSQQEKSTVDISQNKYVEYYIYLNNIQNREAVLHLESLIQKKPGVIYFMAERYPVRCFILRTSNNITAAEFQRWVGTTYPIVTFGTGSLAKEQAYIQYKKNRKTTH